jgi:hypothetical protein
MSTMVVIAAEVGAKSLYAVYIWLASAAIAAELSRSKGYGEKPGLGTGLILTILGPIIWLIIPPKDETAEWHERKPWQRRHKPREAEMANVAATEGQTAIAPERAEGERQPPPE